MNTQSTDTKIDLRRFAGQFPTGVAVITTADNDKKLHGLTMSAVTSLSLTPPLFLICLNNTSNTLTAIKESGHFGINFLSSDQANICKIFASKAEDKFGDVAHTFGPAGSPLIDGALAHGDCVVHSTFGEGDHTIVIARLVHTEVRDSAPLVYHAGKLTALAEAIPA